MTRQFQMRALIAAAVLAALAACGLEHSTEGRFEDSGPERPECIAPSKPGGGFDLTCKLAQKGFRDLNILQTPMRVSYQPGGIGAVALNTVIAQRGDDENLIVAFSGGSLLNLAQGKFGRYTEEDVRWIAASGIDYGMLAVRSDSPLLTLADLLESLKTDPTSIVFGSGGTVGSQDWMKSAIIAREAGIDYRSMRYVPFEGGGEAQIALLGGHIQCYSGDISEVQGLLESGQLRVLAVMSEERLPPPFNEIATAKEQGLDVSWSILRGYYTGPEVSEEAYQWWVSRFEAMMREEEFDVLRHEFGMFPYKKTGSDLREVIEQRMKNYRALAREFQLVPATE